MHKELQFGMRIKMLFFLGIVTLFACHERSHINEERVVLDKVYINEIENIASKEEVQLAFAFIEKMENTTKENQILLNEIPAPPFKEEKRAEQFMKMLKQAGVDSVWMDSIGNVLALRKGTVSKGTVVLDGHLDTVFPEETDVSVKHKGDTLYAPGISDNARSLAMILTIVKALDRYDIRTAADILFVGSVGEEGEGDLRGVKYLCRQMPNITSFISIDIGDIGRITHQAAGSLRYKITFEGPGGHSWGNFGIASPHFALARSLSDWEMQAAEYVKKIEERTTYNIGVIGGGTSVNSIPFESWATIDIRSKTVEHINQLESMLRSAIDKSIKLSNIQKKSGSSLTVRLDKIGDRPAGLTDPDTHIVQRAMAATVYFGEMYNLRTASTNSNFPMSLGIPSITMGQGGKRGGVHTLDEWWVGDRNGKAVQRVLLTLLGEAGY